MAEARLKLPEDPRWLPFLERYQGDIERFGIEVCGYDLSRQQRRLLKAVMRRRSRVSVASGHGTGKTKSISIIVLWHLLCFPMSVGLLTANDVDQLKATLWKEIRATVESIRNGPWGWIAQHVVVGADAHCHVEGFNGEWFWESKTANEKTANKMAGRHGRFYMVIVDEASTVPDPVFSTLSGGLTEADNRMLVTSQYTRTAGYFHRTQTELSQAMGGEWEALVFSSVDSPWVSDEFLKEKFEEYEDDEIRVRLLGLPPEDDSRFFMGLRHAHAMYSRGRIIRDDEPYGWLVLSDNALGEGLRDKSTVVVARVAGEDSLDRRVEVVDIPLFTNKVRANGLAGKVLEGGMGLSNPTYVVDKGGVGTVYQDLEDANATVIPVTWGSPCWKSRNKERYLNQRAQATHHATRAAKEGRLSILAPDHKRQLIAQASGVPIDHTSNFRIKVPEKGSSAWEGRGSPDLWDTVCFAFLENVDYRVADVVSVAGEIERNRRQIVDDALSRFGDLLEA